MIVPKKINRRKSGTQTTDNYLNNKEKKAVGKLLGRPSYDFVCKNGHITRSTADISGMHCSVCLNKGDISKYEIKHHTKKTTS